MFPPNSSLTSLRDTSDIFFPRLCQGSTNGSFQKSLNSGHAIWHIRLRRVQFPPEAGLPPGGCFRCRLADEYYVLRIMNNGCPFLPEFTIIQIMPSNHARNYRNGIHKAKMDKE